MSGLSRSPVSSLTFPARCSPGWYRSSSRTCSAPDGGHRSDRRLRGEHRERAQGVLGLALRLDRPAQVACSSGIRHFDRGQAWLASGHLMVGRAGREGGRSDRQGNSHGAREMPYWPIALTPGGVASRLACIAPATPPEPCSGYSSRWPWSGSVRADPSAFPSPSLNPGDSLSAPRGGRSSWTRAAGSRDADRPAAVGSTSSTCSLRPPLSRLPGDHDRLHSRQLRRRIPRPEGSASGTLGTRSSGHGADVQPGLQYAVRPGGSPFRPDRPTSPAAHRLDHLRAHLSRLRMDCRRAGRRG